MMQDAQRKKPHQYEKAKDLHRETVLNFVSKQSRTTHAQHFGLDANQSSQMPMSGQNARRKQDLFLAM